MSIDPSLISTIRYDQLAPDSISDTSLIAIANGTDLFRITGQDLIDFINTNANAFQYEKKELYVNQAYIDTNFDSSGLGTGIMLGWAICNGNNGTPNDDGLVNIAYGENYNIVGGVGGSKDAVVVAHSHNLVLRGGGSGDTYPTLNDGDGTGRTYTAENTGVDGTNKNMQPYRVVLRIMKL